MVIEYSYGSKKKTAKGRWSQAIVGTGRHMVRLRKSNQYQCNEWYERKHAFHISRGQSFSNRGWRRRGIDLDTRCLLCADWRSERRAKGEDGGEGKKGLHPSRSATSALPSPIQRAQLRPKFAFPALILSLSPDSFVFLSSRPSLQIDGINS